MPCRRGVGLIYVIAVVGHEWLFGPGCKENEISIVYALPGIILATNVRHLPYVARELIPLMQQLGNDEEEAAITLGAGGLVHILPCYAAAHSLGPDLRRHPLQRARDGRIRRRVRGLRHRSADITMTMPLQIEALYNEYNMVGAFAVASVLSLLAVVTLIIKTLVEGRAGYRRR
jgi:sulfate transport system permease protein